jgi:hypothetical protein
MHAQLEENIIKNLTAGQNFEYVMIPLLQSTLSLKSSFFIMSRTGHGKISEMQTLLSKRRSQTTKIPRKKKL